MDAEGDVGQHIEFTTEDGQKLRFVASSDVNQLQLVADLMSGHMSQVDYFETSVSHTLGLLKLVHCNNAIFFFSGTIILITIFTMQLLNNILYAYIFLDVIILHSVL